MDDIKLELEFTKLVKEHKSTIYTVCYMFSEDSDEVSDLFQEILINLWKGYSKFENRSSIKTWFYRVALNTCLSVDRKKKRAPSKVPLSGGIDLYDDTDADNKQTKLLYDRINKLGLFDRAIILLWLEGLPYDEIGQIAGITAKNVSVKLARIRKELKN